MKLVWEYIKYRRFFALLLIMLDALFMLLLWLSQADAAMPGYALLLLTLLELVFAAIDFRHFVLRHRELQTLLRQIFAAAEALPEPAGLIESDYQELVSAVCAARAREHGDL